MLTEKKEILDKRNLEFEKNTTILNSKKHFLEQLEKTNNELNIQLTEIMGKEQDISEIKPKLNKLDVLKSLEEKSIELKNLSKDKERLMKVLDDIERFENVLNENEPFYNDYSLLDSEIHNLQYAKDQFEGSRILI